MGVVTVSTSVTRAPLGTSKSFTNCHTTVRRPVVVAFKNGTSKNPTLVAPQEPVSLPTDSPTDRPKRLTRANRTNKRVKAVSIDAAPPCAVELDYNEAAAKLENIYKLSPTEVSNVDDSKRRPRGGSRRVKNGSNQENSLAEGVKCYVVRSQRRKPKRLSLEKRIIKKDEKVVIRPKSKKKTIEVSGRDVDRLVRDYSVTTDLLSLDWKKMKIPAVLSSTEHTWLFSLMQPMKALLQVADNLEKDLEREPTDGELAKATNMTVQEVRRHIEVGRTARNKLVKHNLRLVLYVINKYFQELASGHKFQDLCQAGAKGLITAIDRFEPKRGLRLSTYGMFWIRHSIMRSMTISSFTRVPFGLESIRMQIQKGKLELLFELGRLPTDDEIIAKVGISPERFYDVMKASKSILSLNAKHSVTQEEFIKGITDIDGVEGDSRMQPALMRLAIDDVLDSLKPKESLVIRQRYGLDGKGDRTLGEIAGNLNISREMVRKYEVKAFMKLKHPARVDYLRRYVV